MYGWYSAEQEQRAGSVVWERVDGYACTVTEVKTVKGIPVDRDAIYMGRMLRYLRKGKEPQQCCEWNHSKIGSC